MTDTQPFVASPAWTSAYPGAVAGSLLMTGVTNPEVHTALDNVREDLEATLRSRYLGKTRAEIRTTGHFPAYDVYYKRFGQNYHVLMQLDSIVNKGKSIPSRAALVEAGFMAEIVTGLLTSGHDLGELLLPITVDVANDQVEYVMYNGTTQTCKPNDMFMRDQTGVISSVILGPAQHARITPETTAVAYCVYAPPGIGEEAVRTHLSEIEANIRLFSPDAVTQSLTTIHAE